MKPLHQLGLLLSCVVLALSITAVAGNGWLVINVWNKFERMPYTMSVFTVGLWKVCTKQGGCYEKTCSSYSLTEEYNNNSWLDGAKALSVLSAVFSFFAACAALNGSNNGVTGWLFFSGTFMIGATRLFIGNILDHTEALEKFIAQKNVCDVSPFPALENFIDGWTSYVGYCSGTFAVLCVPILWFGEKISKSVNVENSYDRIP